MDEHKTKTDKITLIKITTKQAGQNSNQHTFQYNCIAILSFRVYDNRQPY